jgi:hypothetical protein
MAACPQGRPGRPGSEPGSVFKSCLFCGKFPVPVSERDLNTHSGDTSPNRGSITSPS